MNNNIALHLPLRAKETPHKIAVSAPKNQKSRHYEDLTFQQLDERSNSFAKELQKLGLKKDDRVLVFVKPSLNFSVVTFALFRAGLVPIFIDPGMGKKNLLKAITQIKPVGLIAEPEVHFLRLLYNSAFKSVCYFVTTGNLTWGNMLSLKRIPKTTPSDEVMIERSSEDTAAILFTSGGTGIPKGVRYTHKIFNSQIKKLKTMFNLNSNEIDLPGFPLFSLFTISMGMKSAIPAMDPSKPARCNPKLLVQNILDHQATFVAGSPAIWERVGTYCLENNITLPSVKYLVMFGAPVSISLHQKLKKVIICGDTYTPYGATECLPVSNISGDVVLNKMTKKILSGFGTCVGQPVPDTIIKIAPITDSPLVNEFDFEWHQKNQLGEICVYSDTVTPEYIDMPIKTKEAKIKAIAGGIWHRMGDLGYIDNDGLLWFCGRKSHRIYYENSIIPCVPQENIFLSHPLIEKCAYVGPTINNKITPSLVIKPKRSLRKKESDKLKKEVLNLSSSKGQSIPIKKIYYHESFPVDVRHNIKIDRLKIKDAIERGEIQ